MCAFQCDSCFHKKVCMECPSTGGINEACTLYANVENVNSVQQLKAEIAALVKAADDMDQCEWESTGFWVIDRLRQLSAI